MEEPVKESGARKRRRSTREQRLIGRKLRLLLAASGTMGVILAHVRNGGSLIELCDTWGVRYSDVIEWVRADKTAGGRSETYDSAMRDRSEFTDEMVLSEIRSICRFDIRRLYYPKGHAKAGQLIPIEELPADCARMIREVDEGGKVKVYDKLKGLELAGKNRKLYTDSVEHSLGGRLEDILGRSYEEPGQQSAPPPAA